MFGLAQRSRGVSRFARLSNKYAEFTRPDQRVAIFELARVVDINMYSGKFLRHELARNSGMTTRPGSDNVDALNGAQFFNGNLHFFKAHSSLIERDARLNSSPQAFGLFENLANQVMRKLALLNHRSPS